MRTATLSQGKYLAGLFETLECGQLQALIDSRLLIELWRCAAELDPTKVNRDELQRILGLDPSIFTVKMGGLNNTNEIMKALGFPFDHRIMQANFPLKKSESPYEDKIEIVYPGCSFNEKEGLQILKEGGLKRPTYEHAIRFAEQHGTATTSKENSLLIFLHEAWQGPSLSCRIVCLNRSANYRGLGLRCTSGMFGGTCVLAGVRPRKKLQN